MFSPPVFSKGQSPSPAKSPISNNSNNNKSNTPAAATTNKSSSSASSPSSSKPSGEKLSFRPVDSSTAAPGEIEVVRLWNEIEISLKCSNLPPFEPELPPCNSLIALFEFGLHPNDPPIFISQTEVVQCDSSPEFITKFLIPYEILEQSKLHIPFHTNKKYLFQIHSISNYSNEFDYQFPLAFCIVELMDLTMNSNSAQFNLNSQRLQLIYPLIHYNQLKSHELSQHNTQLLMESNFSTRFETTAELSMFDNSSTQFPTLKLSTTAQDRRIPVSIDESMNSSNSADDESDQLQQCVLRVQLADIHNEKEINSNSSSMIAVFVRSSVHSEFSFVGRTEIRRGEAHPIFKKSFLVDFPKNKQWSIMFAVYDIPVNKESASEEDRLGAVICSLDHLGNYPCQKLVYAIEHLTVRQELKRLPNGRLIVELIPLDMFFSWQQEATSRVAGPPPSLPAANNSNSQPIPALTVNSALSNDSNPEGPKSPSGAAVAPPPGLMRARPSLSLHVLTSNTSELIINKKEPTESEKRRERRRSSITTIPNHDPTSLSPSHSQLSTIPQSPNSPTSPRSPVSFFSPSLSKQPTPSSPTSGAAVDSSLSEDEIFAQKRTRSNTTAPSSAANQYFGNRINNPKLESALKEEEQLNVKLNAWRNHHLDQYRCIMMNGSLMKKYQFTGNGTDKRSVYFDWNLNPKKYPAGAIYWNDPGKKPNKNTKCLPIVSITAIYSGRLSPVLQRKSAKSAVDSNCFSLLSKDRSMDFECESESIRNAWVLAVREAVLRSHSNVQIKLASSTGDFPSVPDPPLELQSRLNEIKKIKDKFSNNNNNKAMKDKMDPFAGFNFNHKAPAPQPTPAANSPTNSSIISRPLSPSTPTSSVIMPASPTGNRSANSTPNGSLSAPQSASGSLKNLQSKKSPQFTPTLSKVVDSMPIPQTRAHSNTVVGRTVTRTKAPIFGWDATSERITLQAAPAVDAPVNLNIIWTWDRKSPCMITFNISARSLFLIHENRPSITLPIDSASPDAATKLKPASSHFMIGLFHRSLAAGVNSKYAFIGHTEDTSNVDELSPSFMKQLVFQWPGGSPNDLTDSANIELKFAVYESTDEGVRASDMLGYSIVSLVEIMKASITGASAPLPLPLTHDSPANQEKIKLHNTKIVVQAALSALKGPIVKSSVNAPGPARAFIPASNNHSIVVPNVHSRNSSEWGTAPTSGANSGSVVSPPTIHPSPSMIAPSSKPVVEIASMTEITSSASRHRTQSMGSKFDNFKPVKAVFQPTFNAGGGVAGAVKANPTPARMTNLLTEPEEAPIGKLVSLGVANPKSAPPAIVPFNNAHQPPSPNGSPDGRSTILEEDSDFDDDDDDEDDDELKAPKKGKRSGSVSETGFPSSVSINRMLHSFVPSGSSPPTKMKNELSIQISPAAESLPAIVSRVEISIAGSSFPPLNDSSSIAFGLIGVGPITGDATHFPLHSLSSIVEIDYAEEFSFDTSMEIERANNNNSDKANNLLMRIWQFSTRSQADSQRLQLVNHGKFPSTADSLLGQIQLDIESIITANGDLVDYELRNPYNAKIQKLLTKKSTILDIQFVKLTKGKPFRLPNISILSSPSIGPQSPSNAGLSQSMNSPSFTPLSPVSLSAAAVSACPIVSPAKYLSSVGVSGAEISSTLTVLRPIINQGQVFSCRSMWPDAKSRPAKFENFTIKGHASDQKFGFSIYWNSTAFPNAAPLSIPLRQITDIYIGKHRNALSFASAPPTNNDSNCFAIGGKATTGAIVSLALIADSNEIRDLWVLALLAEADGLKLPIRVNLHSKDGPAQPQSSISLAPSAISSSIPISSPKSVPKKGK